MLFCLFQTMQRIKIPYQETGYFSSLICDYLTENEKVKTFYHRFPSLKNLSLQLKEKAASFSQAQREVLVNRLEFQYKETPVSQLTELNISRLKDANTFTVTTGHQLNLFTGPLYFLYKIVSVINLCTQLNKAYPTYHFVPVYWMATEDHDFEEINYFNLFSEKLQWKREASGAVGELSTQGLEMVFEKFSALVGNSEVAKTLKNLFSEAYLQHQNLADATRYLANELFKDTGLVILDGNDHPLKKQFVPFAKKELTEQFSYNQIFKTTQRLIQAGYHEQVHPRTINLFYLHKGIRERIVKKDGLFTVLNTSLVFTEEELIAELNQYPERFSPNALLRPLYQEVILPNLAYIGGGGELAYWFQLKDYFTAISIPFPVLILRNSVLMMPQKISKKLQKLSVPVEKLFLSPEELAKWYVKKITDIPIDFSSQKNYLRKQFSDLYELAKKTDASFLGAVAAQEKKQLNGLDKLEKRLLKAQKRKLKNRLDRLLAIQKQLFPNGSLQERNRNFSELYVQYNDTLFELLYHSLNPLCMQFLVIETA